jgi:hypothetical protein
MTARCLGVSSLWLLLLAGCSGDDTELGFAELSVDVADESGAQGRVSCEPLPLLAGSHRYTEHVIDGRFTITVFTSSSEARVSFREGRSSLDEERVIERAALEGDYRDQVAVLLGSGLRYTVTLGAGCAP